MMMSGNAGAAGAQADAAAVAGAQTKVGVQTAATADSSDDIRTAHSDTTLPGDLHTDDARFDSSDSLESMASRAHSRFYAPSASSQCTYPYETLGLPRVARVMIHRLRAKIRRRLVAILLVAGLVLMVTFDFEYVFASLEVAIPANVILALAAAWALCAASLYFGVARPLKRLHRLSGTARGRGGTPALIEAVSSRQYQRVVESASRRSLPDVPKQDQGDASVVVPTMADAEHRLECRIGAAFAVIDPRDSADSLRDPRFAAAWRVHETTSPLMAASGTVVDTLVFEVHSRLKESSDSQASVRLQVHVARFYQVEFTDDGGVLRRVWSDSLWERFGKGDAVTVYWYRIASGAHAGIRIHDLADASLPVDVRDHAAQLFNFAWSDVAEWLLDGRPVKKRSVIDSLHDALVKDIQLGPTMAPVKGSYGEALDGKPWGKQYRFLPVAGYCYERMPGVENGEGDDASGVAYRAGESMLAQTAVPVLPVSAADAKANKAKTLAQGQQKNGRKGKSGKRKPHTVDSRILHSAVWDVRPGTDASQIWDVESPYETRLIRREGVVRDVREIPLFSRRRYCGQGYMALVEFSYVGFTQKIWAFGDPARSDSYLGQTSPVTFPVALGDTVTLWLTRGEGPNLVAPCDADAAV